MTATMETSEAIKLAQDLVKYELPIMTKLTTGELEPSAEAVLESAKRIWQTSKNIKGAIDGRLLEQIHCLVNLVPENLMRAAAEEVENLPIKDIMRREFEANVKAQSPPGSTIISADLINPIEVGDSVATALACCIWEVAEKIMSSMVEAIEKVHGSDKIAEALETLRQHIESNYCELVHTRLMCLTILANSDVIDAKTGKEPACTHPDHIAENN